MKMTRTLALSVATLALVGLAACGSPSAEETEAPAAADTSSSAPQEETETETETETPKDAASLPEGEPGMDEEGDEVTAWTLTLDDTTYVVDTMNMEPGTTFAAFGYGSPVILDFAPEAPEDIEAYRQAVGEDEVGYVRLDADNREGARDIRISDIAVYDSEGNTYEFESAFIPVGDWGPQWTGEYNDANEYEMSDGSWIPEEEYDALNDQGAEVYDEHLDNDVPVHAKGTAYYIGDVIPDDAQIVAVSYTDSLETGVAFPATAQG